MYQDFRVTEVIEPYFKENEWCWWLDDNMKLRLDSVIHFERPTKRHKMKIVKQWNRLSGRSRENTMERPEPTETLMRLAQREVMDSLTFD